MYVVTFYSFKGGVGRTLAMINVAAQLRSEGKTVLLVDFDLEAPGVETHFEENLHDKNGVLDFFSEYNDSFSSGSPAIPDIKNYIHKCTLRHEDEVLDFDIMPAGDQGNAYKQKLSKLDWRELYEKKKGYLLIEDLRKQWEQKLGIDYVFIDSRTGHTDIGGICTRHLPDAVVAMAFPNEQNRVGLAQVINEITTSSERVEKIHLVLSRIPTADDEDNILRNVFYSFEDDTNIPVIDFETIPHYESMDLINQKIFTLTRPNTRLAKQYKKLTSDIRMFNIQDEGGVLIRLKSERPLLGAQRDKDSENRSYNAIYDKEQEEIFYNKIKDVYRDNAEVLFFGGKRAKRRVSGRANALELFYSALDQGKNEALPEIAELEQYFGKVDEANEAALEALRNGKLNSSDFDGCLTILTGNSFDAQELIESIKVKTLSAEKLKSLEDILSSSENSNLYLKKYLEAINFNVKEQKNVENNDDSTANVDRLLHLITANMYDDAYEIGKLEYDKGNRDVFLLFNFGMIGWVINGVPDVNIFKQITFDNIRNDENYIQCWALSEWIIGEKSKSLKILKRLKKMLRGKRKSWKCFSPWSYKNEKFDGFFIQLNKMEQAILDDPDCIITKAPFVPSDS